MNCRSITLQICIWALLVSGASAWGYPFASSVYDSQGPFGGSPYDDPNSLLGKPTTWVYDGWSLETYGASMVYAAWNTDPSGGKLITTLNTNSYITVEFDDPIVDDPANWYDLDFLVFGNGFLTGEEGWVEPDTDMENYHVKDGGGFFESVSVSVSQDASNWYTYTSPVGDSMFPTNPFAWDRTTHDWGAELDWTKPVDPSLTGADFAGLSVADAIDNLYDGSAGGTGFDLAESGYSWIKYIQVTSSGGEIDGFSRVSRMPEPGTACLFLLGLSAFALRRRSRKE